MRRPQSFYLFSLHAADKTRPKMDPNVPQETPVDVREMRESNIVEYQGSFLNPFGGHLWFTLCGFVPPETVKIGREYPNAIAHKPAICVLVQFEARA